MRYFIVICAALLAACQPADTDNDLPLEDEAVEVDTIEAAAPVTTVAKAKPVPKDGRVRIVLQTPVSEPRACIVPIRVENGLNAAVNVTLIGFSVTGPGDDTTGNMFAPTAASGTLSEARVILEGQSCDAFTTINVPDVLCKSEDEDCSAKVEFEDGGGLSFSQAG